VTLISSSRVPNAMCTPVGACSFTAVAAETATATSASPNNRRMTLCEICCRCFPKPRESESNDATLSEVQIQICGARTGGEQRRRPDTAAMLIRLRTRYAPRSIHDPGGPDTSTAGH
jgi:hypothetical protein